MAYMSSIVTHIELLCCLLRELVPSEGNWKPGLNISNFADVLKKNPKTTREYVNAALTLKLIEPIPDQPLRADLGENETGPHGNVYVITGRGLEFLRCLES